MERQQVAERLVEFRVLGSIEVRVDGVVVDIGGFRQRRLLAVMLSRAGRVVETDALAEYVWDDDERPANAVEATRTYVSRLRHSFADAGLDASSLFVTRSPGYLLDLDSAEVDSIRFERLVVEARETFDAGDAVSASVTLDEALSLWRGTPFQEFADRSWAEADVTRLGELHLVALEQRAAARLDLGAHAEVVGDLEQLVKSAPLRSRPVELLMLALFRSGRQAEALRTAARFRRAVADVGLDPPVSMNELESRIAESDESLRPLVASTDTIRGYRLAEKIGEGSFSVVYRSIQPSLGREVAVKQIRAELADRPDFIRRFESEAQIVAGLEHPHIVPLYDYWREPGAAYLVMRWLRGGTLESRLARQRLDADESVTLAVQIGSALDAAHRAGIEHRDVRTANVFVDDIGNNYLGDFGIAIEHDGGDIAGGAVDDLRGLGGVLFEAITGRRPNADGNGTAIDHNGSSLVTLRPDLPPAVEGVLLRAIIGSGDERYDDIGDFVDDYAAAFNRSAAGRSPSAKTIPLVADVSNPYKGLRAFQESDAHHFRGRGRLTDRLLSQLAQPGTDGRFVAVVGPSGSGKSSLVRAGLVPRVRNGAIEGSESWFVTTMLPGAHPFEEFEAALNRIASRPTADLVEMMRSDPNGIARAVGSVLPDEAAELLLIVDQFEELFIVLDDAEIRDRFLEGLLAAVTVEHPRLRVVVTIRADHWHLPLQHPDLARVLETSALTVAPMAADELERAIADPAHSMGVTFDPGLVSDIVAEVHDQPGALPLMQYLLTELFDARRAGLMDIETYREIGGVTGSLARRADDIYARSSEEEQVAIQRLFSRLVTPGEGAEHGRRRVLLSELAIVPDDIIERFDKAHMLTFDHDPSTREPTVEVAHEALIREWPMLRRWVDEHRDGLHITRHLTAAATEWDATGRPDSDLYRGARLEVARAWAGEHTADLTELERAFLDAATQQQVRERTAEFRRVRRLRALLATVAAVAVIALIATAIAVTQRGRADDNAREASEQAAAAEDLAALEGEARRAAETARDEADAARLAALDAEGEASASRDEAIAAGDEASASRDEAVIQGMISRSASVRDDQPTLSMLIAREAYDRSPRPDTLGALLTSLQRTDGYLGFMPGTETSSNDQWLGVLDAETVVRRTLDSIDVYDLPSRTLVGSTPSEALPISFFVTGSVGGGRFTTVTAEGGVVTIAPGSREPTPMAIPEGESAAATASGENGSVVVGYASGAVDVFSGPDLDERKRLGVHPHPVVYAAISDDATLVVTNDQYANITLWDVGTVSPVWTWTLGAAGTGDADAGSLHVARIENGSELRVELVDGGPRPAPVATGWPQGIVGALDFSSDGRSVYSLIAGVTALDVETGALRWQATGLTSQLQIAELPDGSLLHGNRSIRDGEIEPFDFDILPSSRTAATPDGSTMIAANADGLTLWALHGEQLIATSLDRGAMNQATVDASGKRLAGFAIPGLAPNVLWDLSEERPVDDPSAEGIGPWRSFTTGGEFFSYHVGEPRLIELRDPVTMERLGPPLPPQTWASVELSPNRSIVAVGDIFDTAIDIYDVETAELLRTLAEPLPTDTGSGVWWIEFSPDGTRLVTSNLGGLVVWDTTTWQATHEIIEPEDEGYTSVTFSPDGTELAIGTQEGSVLLYDLGSRDTRLLTTGVAVPRGIYHENSLEFSDDGRYLIVAGQTANMIDTGTGQLVGAAFENGGLNTATIAHGGRYLVTGDADRIHVWELRPEKWPDLACRAAGRNMTLAEWERFGPPGEPYHATCDEWPTAV